MALSFLGTPGRDTLGRTFPSFDNFVHERTLIHRRLIVACRRSGETDIFVITWYHLPMPVEISGKVWKLFTILEAVINKNFKESPSARNMNTNKNLAKDCE